MTPLAQTIIRDAMKPVRERLVQDQGDIVSALRGAQFFEVSAVEEMAQDLGNNVDKIIGSDATTFLPAPKTWIEWVNPNLGSGKRTVRNGWLMRQNPADRMSVYLTNVIGYPDVIWAETEDPDPLHLVNGPTFDKLNATSTSDQLKDGWHKYGPDNLLLAFLLFINTPRVIGRRQHMPHRGLQKTLLKQRGPIGSFPLNGWTEILLKVTPPDDLADVDSAEAHLTGQRALHFCRAHLRVRLGRLEFIRSHWRGDASLGVKNSRYRVTA